MELEEYLNLINYEMKKRIKVKELHFDVGIDVGYDGKMIIDGNSQNRVKFKMTSEW